MLANWETAEGKDADQQPYFYGKLQMLFQLSLIIMLIRDNPTNQKNIPAFHLIFESLPGNYLILKPDAPTFTIVAVSDAYARASMCARADLIDKGLFEVFPDNPNDPLANGVANLTSSLNQVLLTRQPHKMAVQRYDIQDPGKNKFAEKYWSPLNTPVLLGGEVVYIIHQVEDITEKVKTSDALQTQTEELKRTNAELEQFVRVSSHDLQEPARKIQTFADLLMAKYRNQLDSFGAQLVAKINDSALKLGNRLKDLLKYAYLRNEESFSIVNLQEVCMEVCDDLELLIEERNAKVEIETMPVIYGIRQQLHQLFYNLISNSLKFCHEVRPVKIKISVRRHTVDIQPQARPYYEIIVADNGRGFDLQYADRIFTVFEQLSKGPGQTGTGMGLAICKKVVQNHGGHITAYGEPGVGARFHVFLPR